MFDRVLNITLGYLSCFAVFLRGIHGNVDICQLIIVLPPSLEFSPLFWSHTRKYSIKVNQRLAEVKEKWPNNQFDVFVLSFSSFQGPNSKYHKQKWRVLFFTRIRLVSCVLACAHEIARIKSIRLHWCVFWSTMFWKKDILFVSIPKQMPFLTISNKNISCKTKGSRTKMSRASTDFNFFFFLFDIFRGMYLDKEKSKGAKIYYSNTLPRYVWVEINFTWIWAIINKGGPK